MSCLLKEVNQRTKVLKGYPRKLSNDFALHLSYCNLDELRELNVMVFNAYDNTENLKNSIKNFMSQDSIQENKEILMNKNKEFCLEFISVQKVMVSLEALKINAQDAA